MTDFEDIATAISSRFEAQIETPYSVQVVYDNETDDVNDTTLASNLWIRFTILWGESFMAEMPGTFRTSGVAVAQIFQRLERGDQEALAMADNIVAAFRKTSADGVSYYVPSIARIGRSDRWWQINVSIPFSADDVT